MSGEGGAVSGEGDAVSGEGRAASGEGGAMSGGAGLPPFGDRPIAEDDLAALAAAVEGAAFQQGDFSHARHLLLALHYVRAHGPEAALERMRSALQAFNARHPPRTGYHETITVAWIALVAHHAAEHAGASVHDLAESLLRIYGSSKALFAHYSPARLLSDEARAAFVAPDLAPLPVPGDDRLPRGGRQP
ncbi:hypothetical protein WMF04_34225 [Sorangium sp. So ce260]|uniref:hypothetical protein n=1 Tax=Sorangium sp. So ce260 TaxID=3133291 RepID=UPI003F62E677